MPISEVYNMDCMEYMKGIPDKFFDLAVVDPPYGIGVTKMNMGGRNTIRTIRNIMEIIKLTKKEEEWIKELKKLIRKKPKNLILFADGNLNILKLDKDDNDGVGENGRMKSDRMVEIILNACDGGVF